MPTPDVDSMPLPEPTTEQCPNCKSRNTFAVYRPEIYEYDFVCKDCEKGFNK